MLKKKIHAFRATMLYWATLNVAHQIACHIGQIVVLVRDELVVEFSDKVAAR
jgi:hypothetical protein